MGRVVITEFLSLDGVMEDPGGAEGFRHGGWSFKFSDPEGMKFKLDEQMEAEVLLLGRVTYEGFAKAWPDRTDDAGFAEKMNSMPKYVASTTLTDLQWNNSKLLEGEVPAAVARLREEVPGVILVAGSRTLAQTLLAHNLVDELRLMVFPVVLGSGKRLFGETEDALNLELAACQQLNSGTLILTYRRAEAAEPAS
jgi:dihydrofolate reductase